MSKLAQTCARARGANRPSKALIAAPVPTGRAPRVSIRIITLVRDGVSKGRALLRPSATGIVVRAVHVGRIAKPIYSIIIATAIVAGVHR